MEPSADDEAGRHAARRWVAASCLATATAALLGCGAADPGGAAVVATADDSTEELQEVVGWLPAHQSADGRWEAAGFDRWRMGENVEGGGVPGLGHAREDVAVTSLVTLALVARGVAPTTDLPDGRALAWALHALRSAQRDDGSLADPAQPMGATSHALAALALVVAAERFRYSEDLAAAIGAARFYGLSRERGERAWLDEKGPGDLPPFAWLARAGWEAGRSGSYRPAERRQSLTRLDVEPALVRDRELVESWLGDQGHDASVARVGLALLLHPHAEASWKEADDVRAAAAWLAAHAPAWEPSGRGVDVAGWWLGTEALDEVKGEAYETWNDAVKTGIVDSQRHDTTYCLVKGSWDPLGVWAAEGGRVFSAAAGGLALSVHYRYERCFCDRGDDAPEPPAAAPPSPPPPPAPRPMGPLPERRYPRCDPL